MTFCIIAKLLPTLSAIFATSVVCPPGLACDSGISCKLVDRKKDIPELDTLVVYGLRLEGRSKACFVARRTFIRPWRVFATADKSQADSDNLSPVEDCHEKLILIKAPIISIGRGAKVHGEVG